MYVGTSFWILVDSSQSIPPAHAVTNITMKQAFGHTGDRCHVFVRILLTVVGPLSSAYQFYSKFVDLYQKHPVEIVIEVVLSLLGNGICS